MAQRPIGVTDLASEVGVARYRTRERVVSAETVVEQYLLSQEAGVVSWRGCAGTFMISGVSTSPNIPIASLWNDVGSGVIVAVRGFGAAMDSGATSGLFRSLAASGITVAPTGGTVGVPVGFDTAQTQASLVVFRGGASADGTNTTITAPPGPHAWRQYNVKAPSGIGQFVMPLANLVPQLAYGEPVYLAEGQGLVVAYIENSTSALRYLVNIAWDEVSFP